MRRLTLALAVVLLAGCGGGGPTISGKNLGRRVLHDADLPRPFSSFYNGRQSKLDVTSGFRADPRRYDRKAGWIARYRRAGSTQTRGPLVVVSAVDVFGDSKGAGHDLDAYRRQFDTQPGAGRRALHPPSIGDDAAAVTFVQPGPLRVRFYTIAWRYRNVTASVTAEGFNRRITFADAARLARRQQKRIASG